MRAGDLHPAWRDFRSRRRLFWAAVIGSIPALWVFSLIDKRFPRSDAPAFVALPWMLVLGICIIRYGFFRCPRCGERFFTEKSFPWVSRLWTRRCMNCGLKRWAAPDAVEPHAPAR